MPSLSTVRTHQPTVTEVVSEQINVGVVELKTHQISETLKGLASYYFAICEPIVVFERMPRPICECEECIPVTQSFVMKPKPPVARRPAVDDIKERSRVPHWILGARFVENVVPKPSPPQREGVNNIVTPGTNRKNRGVTEPRCRVQVRLWQVSTAIARASYFQRVLDVSLR